jgi:hypothetical protein
MDPDVSLPPEAQSPPPEPPDLDNAPEDWPPPPEEEIEQWRWICQGCRDGTLRPYAGQHIAVVNKQVIASHPNPEELYEILRRDFNLDPYRLTVAFID